MEARGFLLSGDLTQNPDCSRLEIVSGLNPREIVSGVVLGGPTQCVGGCVGGNPVSGGKFVLSGLRWSYWDLNWKNTLSVSSKS